MCSEDYNITYNYMNKVSWEIWLVILFFASVLIYSWFQDVKEAGDRVNQTEFQKEFYP